MCDRQLNNTFLDMYGVCKKPNFRNVETGIFADLPRHDRSYFKAERRKNFPDKHCLGINSKI